MPTLDTETLIRLYRDDGLSLSEIGERFGLSRQAVHQRLEKAGVERPSNGTRPSPPSPLIDEKVLRELCLEERLTVFEIAKRLGTKVHIVRVSRIRYGITTRGGRRLAEHPGLAKLKIGQSIVVPRSKSSRSWHNGFYPMARKLGIRLKLRILGDLSVRLTRVG